MAYIRAMTTQKLQNKLVRPNTRIYLKGVENNFLPNFPLTREEILAEEDIFVPYFGAINGETVDTRPNHVNVDILQYRIVEVRRDSCAKSDFTRLWATNMQYSHGPPGYLLEWLITWYDWSGRRRVLL